VIQSDADLRRVRVGCVKHSSGEEYCLHQRIPYLPYDNLKETIDDMLNGNIDAIVYNIPVLRHYKHSFYHEKVLISRKTLQKNNMGIALPHNSPLREKINLELLDYINTANWDKLSEKYLGEDD